MIPQFKNRFEKLGFSVLSPIQEAVYEPLKNGDSVLGLAPTGSGKTLGFVVPILERLEPEQGIQAIIIAPSQELAMQLTGVTRSFATLVNLKVTSVTGGANVKRQLEQLKKHPEVVIGTPGRLLNLIEDRKLKTHNVQTVIVDEADDLLDGETFDTVRTILQNVPAEVQLGFFSATETPILSDLQKWFGMPVRRIDVRAKDHTQGEVRHGLMEVSNAKKASLLGRLSSVKQFKGLVFFNHVGALQQTKSTLTHHHVPVAVLTADQRQTERQKALTDFRLGRVKLLLSTDVAARGLDIAKLPAVVNFDLPETANIYTHRVGRTGRMGEPGQVINFGDDHDLRDLKRLLKDTDYQLVPVYYQDHQITTSLKAETTQPVDADQVAIPEAKTAGQARGSIDAPTEATRQPRVKASLPAPTRKKKGHHKHLKRKGMRHKHIKEAEQNDHMSD
ncbi:DEAD/DEAH box helicase [Lactobacillus sp. CRM56-3]|uniref:DEAD/DEAH box helicase n=2 Tax=Secundilactobacillus folii TaxID=2678357 RepID=A0A7X2XUR0_9LACO|nr:DEAD/DEAH box helicase [Secundilactobacillus folii]